MKTFKNHPRVHGFSEKENKRRYVLHRELRKRGFKIITAKKNCFFADWDKNRRYSIN